MTSRTIALLLFLFSALTETVLSCGELQTSLIPFLTHAQLATHRWPWHVAIYHQGGGKASDYKCGGTLVSATVILTAAHCVLVPEVEITVSAGRVMLDAITSSTQFHQVAKITRHPDYLQVNQKNDIAIIELATPAIFNNYVQPVCLWNGGEIHLSNIVGKFGTVVGWGRTETGEVSNTLRQAALPVVDVFTCLESNSDVFGRFLSRTSFCAGNRNGTSVCTGDSGGSMTFEENGKFYIRGVASVGPTKIIYETQQIVCDPMHYVVFTDVVPYLPWIQSLVNVVVCERKVRCDLRRDECIIALHGSSTTTGCRIIIDEVPNAEVIKLTISGKSDVIPELSEAAAKFPNLEHLVLGVGLKAVHRDRLTQFRYIKKLVLSLNSISRFDADDTFDDLKVLERLDLSNNQLDELPAHIFRNNEQLRDLSLFANQLKELPVNLFEYLVNLEEISLSLNKLETVPTGLFRNNIKVKEISLNFNKLKDLHVDLFAQLINLEYCNAAGNTFEMIPADLFRNNGQLLKINFEINQLTELHVDQFKNLVHLEEISFRLNRLEIIPAGLFRNNLKLKLINFESNKIRRIDLSLTTHSAIRTLDISRNVCIDEKCGSVGSCDAQTLAKIFDKIQKNCREN